MVGRVTLDTRIHYFFLNCMLLLYPVLTSTLVLDKLLCDYNSSSSSDTNCTCADFWTFGEICFKIRKISSHFGLYLCSYVSRLQITSFSPLCSPFRIIVGF